MSIDLPTILFQVINFLVLVLILWRLLWKPLRAHMRARSARIEEGLSQVEAGRDEVERLREEAEQTLSDARSERAEKLRGAEVDAEARRNEIVDEARATAQHERQRLLAEIDRENQRREVAAVRELRPHIVGLVSRVLSGIGDDAHLHERTALRFAERLRNMEQTERDELQQAFDRGPAELRAAAAIPQELRRTLIEVLGACPQTSIDASLVGGVVLRVGDLVLDGSLSRFIERALEGASGSAESQP